MHRRHPLLLALLLGLALLGLPVLAAGSASAADPCTPGPTCLATRVLIAAPSRAIYKHAMSVTGRLEAQSQVDQTKYAPVDGQTVTLQRKLVGESDFSSVDDAVTDASGEVSFSAPAVKNARYQLVYAGGTYTFSDGTSVDLAPSTSTPRGIQVYRDLHEHDVQKGGKIFLAGNVDPGWGGKTIYLQRKTCAKCAWKAYTKQQTTSTGGWRFRTPAPAHGSWYWRAYVPASSDYLKTTSAILRTYMQYL